MKLQKGGVQPPIGIIYDSYDTYGAAGSTGNQRLYPTGRIVANIAGAKQISYQLYHYSNSTEYWIYGIDKNNTATLIRDTGVVSGGSSGVYKTYEDTIQGLGYQRLSISNNGSIHGKFTGISILA